MLSGTERALLALIWLAVGVLSARRGLREARREWWVCAGLAALLASVRLVRWDIELWQVARRALRSAGLYEDRGVFKLALGFVIAAAAVTVGLKFGRRFMRLPRGLRYALGAMLSMLLFVSLVMVSLEHLLPVTLMRPPGRYILEFGLPSVALCGILAPDGDDAGSERT